MAARWSAVDAVNYFLQGKINLDSYSQSGPASGDTPGGRDLYCGGS